MSARQGLGLLLTLGLVVWATVAFALRWKEVAARPFSISEGPTMLWRPGSVQEQRWSEFLTQVRQRVPQGSTILVQADQVEPSDEFFLTLWCAYHLPRHNVVRESNLTANQPVRYVLRPNGAASLLAQKVENAGSTENLRNPGDPSSAQRGQVLLSGVGVLELMNLGGSEADRADQSLVDG